MNSLLIKDQYKSSLHQTAFVLPYPGEPTIVAPSTVHSWWRMTGSNRRPPACKAGALPAELIPRDSSPDVGVPEVLVGLVGLEPTTPALSTQCSNQLSYRPIPFLTPVDFSTSTRLGLFQQPISVDVQFRAAFFQKGGDPAAPSDTATLLRLHPSHEPRRGKRPPCG